MSLRWNTIRMGACLFGLILLSVIAQPVKGFSTAGNFFETDDIVCWLNYNDDYTDKSINNYPVTACISPVTYQTSFCYDEKLVSFPNQNPNQFFDFNTATAKQDLNLNNQNTDCHIRISMWIDPDDNYGSSAPGAMALASKYYDSYPNAPQTYLGWELELEDINNGGGRLRFKVDDPNNPGTPYMVTLDPRTHFSASRNLFYGETFVVAGWDFDPNADPGPAGILWIKAIIKSDPNTFTIYRNYLRNPIINLPSSTTLAMRVGDHSRSSPGDYVGLMDEFCISRGHPAEQDFMYKIWEANEHSLPHENQIAYYNFENIQTKNSITYDEECDMFFDGAHVVPHNGKIVDENYQGSTSTSWDGSDCLELDGSNYGQIKRNIDGWGYSGGNFALTGWPQNQYDSNDDYHTKKKIEVGCIFNMEKESIGDQILMSKYGKFNYIGGSYHHGYKIGIDSNNKFFADLAINYTTTRTSINSYTLSLNTWYKCLLYIEKYEINGVYHIDVEVKIWEYSGGAWIVRGSNTYSYSNSAYISGYPPIQQIDDISDWTNGDPIIGGTWDSNLNMQVIDKFEGKIDDVKWYKSLAFNVRGYNKYFENNV